MEVFQLVQKLKQSVNNSKDFYDQFRSLKALEAAAATTIAATTDADFAPYNMTKAQYLAASSGIGAVMTTYEANDEAILDIYG